MRSSVRFADSTCRLPDVCSSLRWTRSQLLHIRPHVLIPDDLWHVLWRVDFTLFIPRLPPLPTSLYCYPACSPDVLASSLCFTVQALSSLDLRPGHSLLVLGSGVGFANQVASYLLRGSSNIGVTSASLLAHSQALSVVCARLDRSRADDLRPPTFTTRLCQGRFDRMLVGDCSINAPQLFLLRSRLVPGGRLVSRVRRGHHTVSVVVERTEDDFEETELSPQPSCDVPLCTFDIWARDELPVPISSPFPLSLAAHALRSLVRAVDPTRALSQVEAFYKSVLPLPVPLSPHVSTARRFLVSPDAGSLAVACSALQVGFEAANRRCHCPFTAQRCLPASIRLDMIRRRVRSVLDSLCLDRGSHDQLLMATVKRHVDELGALNGKTWSSLGQLLSANAARLVSDAIILQRLLESRQELAGARDAWLWLGDYAHDVEKMTKRGRWARFENAGSRTTLRRTRETVQEWGATVGVRIAAENLLVSVESRARNPCFFPVIVDGEVDFHSETYFSELERLNCDIPEDLTEDSAVLDLIAARLVLDLGDLIADAEAEEEEAAVARMAADSEFLVTSALRAVLPRDVDEGCLMQGVDVEAVVPW